MGSDGNPKTITIPARTAFRWADLVCVEDPNDPEYEKFQEKFGI